MAKIEFKAKVRQRHHIEGGVAYEYVEVPEFKRSHCDMNAFRKHTKYGNYANSDLFIDMLKRIRKDVFGGSMLKLDAIPNGVTVNTSGFLAVVSFEV